MKIYFICRHKPTEIDEKKATQTTACACGETRRAGVSVSRPTFAATGNIAARGPLVKQVNQ